MKKIHILHLNENFKDAKSIQATLLLADNNLNFEWVNNKEEFEKAILNPELDLILSDSTLQNYTGLEALKFTKEHKPNIPFILLSKSIGEQKAIDFFRAGAFDFIIKDDLQHLPTIIYRALKELNEKRNREIAEAKMKERDTLFQLFTDHIPDVFYHTSADLSKTIYVSPAYEKIFGKKVDELYQSSFAWANSIQPEDQPRVIKAFETMRDENKDSLEIEFVIIRADGEKRTILSRSSLVKDKHGNATGLIGISKDITQRVELDKKLQATLSEKESMLKEIYHRVKNNLQVVSSLLNLQAKNIKDPVAKKIFIESSSRVKAMGLVHEMLYRTGDLSQIEMATYVKNLSQHLMNVYHIDTNLIKLVNEVENVRLRIEEAIPCGLIINELISNAYKYAFPEKRPGEIKITMKNNKNIITLLFQDNGVGLPPDIDFRNTTTLGMQLITNLIKQLSGTVMIDCTHGTTFTLTFPI